MQVNTRQANKPYQGSIFEIVDLKKQNLLFWSEQPTFSHLWFEFSIIFNPETATWYSDLYRTVESCRSETGYQTWHYISYMSAWGELSARWLVSNRQMWGGFTPLTSCHHWLVTRREGKRIWSDGLKRFSFFPIQVNPVLLLKELAFSRQILLSRLQNVYYLWTT